MEIGATLSMGIYSLTSMCGILFNGILLYLVLYHTPKSLKTYSNLILNLALCDFVCCIFVLSSQDRIIPAAESVIFIANGPCKFISSGFCYQRFYPHYDNFTGAIYGVRNVLKFGPMYTILHMTLPVTPIYIAIVIIRSKIIKRLNNVESMSTNTKFVHRQLLKHNKKISNEETKDDSTETTGMVARSMKIERGVDRRQDGGSSCQLEAPASSVHFMQ
ncbi:unnamed protein product [Cylicocyclus nassatus]|uniref:G-protein coupled receptors family 1 profile domain-containing protein n=1 Tax=Cylicocyclus nassatus TaxID=53992 RepID=A0AA36H385_CYLNA|nr:unnamed protein product [Cylicocyclus nassatus]